MSQAITLHTAGAVETKALAAALAQTLRPGDLVALTGELGAGKTCFVQGAVAALGVTERVTSPSFVLRREYAGRMPIVHLDVYRLETLQEVLDLGFDEPAEREAVVFVEWADAMRSLLPGEHLEVELRYAALTDERADADVPAEPAAPAVAERRTVVLRPHGAAWARRLHGLGARLDQWREPPW